MKFYITNGCCFCASLRTGGLILGWLYTVFGLLGSIMTFVFLGFMLSQNSDSDVIFIGDHPFMDKATFVTTFSMSGIFLLLAAISGILLIIGIKQGRKDKLIMFMLITAIGTIFNIYNIYVFSTMGLYEHLFKRLVKVALSSYFLCVVYSLYVKIKKDENLSNLVLA